MEQHVDIPVPGGGGRRGRKRRTRLWLKLERRPGQGSTAFCGAEQETLPDSRPGQAPQRFVGQNKKLLLIHAQDMAPQRLVEHNMAFSRDSAPQRLVEHIMDFSRDRAQQHFMEQNFMDFSRDRAQQHLMELNIFIIFLLCLQMEGAVAPMPWQSSGPCVSACSSVLARATRGTSARLHMHGKSSILTLLSGACRRGIHRQPRAV